MPFVPLRGGGDRIQYPTRQVIESIHPRTQIGATLGQQVRHLLHCVTLRIADDVAINSQRDPCIGMAQLSLGYGWRRADFQKQTRMHVTKRMQAAFWNVQFFDDIFAPASYPHIQTEGVSEEKTRLLCIVSIVLANEQAGDLNGNNACNDFRAIYKIYNSWCVSSSCPVCFARRLVDYAFAPIVAATAHTS